MPERPPPPPPYVAKAAEMLAKVHERADMARATRIRDAFLAAEPGRGGAEQVAALILVAGNVLRRSPDPELLCTMLGLSFSGMARREAMRRAGASADAGKAP